MTTNDQSKVVQADSESTATDDPAETHAIYRRSVCISCQHRRTIVSGKGSVFMLCQSPAVELGWPKYPPQPLANCKHLEVADSPGAE
ncbi:MAG: hypothetical protein MUC83_19895 [Pirellula sp.]|nr:hypothetical protein [Pirellula sp.]